MTAARKLAEPVARPAAFVEAMVRAIIEGRKTNTRRIVTPQPPTPEAVHALAGTGYSWMAPSRGIVHWRPAGPVWAVRQLMGCEPELRCPHGAPGDLIWVREGWRTGVALDPFNATTIAEKCVEAGYRKPWAPVVYADGATHNGDTLPDFGGAWGRYRTARFMPRWASRILLRVTSVRVERLDEITNTDAEREGLEVVAGTGQTPKGAFARLWDSINGKRAPWSSRPWVWVIGFEQCEEARRAHTG